MSIGMPVARDVRGALRRLTALPAAVDWCRRKFELPASPGRNLAMEGVRGVAVLLVFCAHFSQLFGEYFRTGGLSWKLAHYPGAVGHTGVDLFFILSGYLIYGAVIRKPVELGKFLRRRVLRIYPAFAAVFLLYAALSAAFPGESKIPAGVGPAAYYLLQNFLLLPGMFDTPAMNSVAWSLSYEFFYYLALPVAVLVFGMRRWSARRRLLCCAGVGLAYLAVWWTAFAAGTSFPIRFRLLTFVFGIGMHELLHSGWAQKPHGPRGEAGALALFAGALVASYELNAGRLAALDPPLGILLEVFSVSVGFTAFLVYAAGRRGWIHRALVWTPLRWLGNMSYSYYLIHLAALHGAALLLPRVLPFSAVEPIPYFAAAAASFGITAVAAAVLFVTVERPLSLDGRGFGTLGAARAIRARVFGALAVFAPSRPAAEGIDRREEPAP